VHRRRFDSRYRARARQQTELRDGPGRNCRNEWKIAHLERDARERAGASSARNVLEGVVAEVVKHGALARVTLEVGDLPLVATVTAGSVSELGLLPGSRAVATIKATAVHLC
jgi:molybdopterin-binding protein